MPSEFSYVKAAPVRTEQCIASHNAKLAEGRYACAHGTSFVASHGVPVVFGLC